MAFTLSTAPKESPDASVAPISGSSTKTTSPSSSWAWSVMPTVATPSSTRTHSWLLVYWRSPGTDICLPSLLLLSLVERQRHGPRLDGPVAYDDVEGIFHPGRDERKTYGLAELRGLRSAGDPADGLAAHGYRVVVARDAAPLYPEADELLSKPLLLL